MRNERQVYPSSEFVFIFVRTSPVTFQLETEEGVFSVRYTSRIGSLLFLAELVLKFLSFLNVALIHLISKLKSTTSGSGEKNTFNI